MITNKLNINDSKGIFYQTKTLSDNNISGQNIKTLQLLNLIETYQINQLNNFLEKEKLSPQILNESIISLLKKYNKENSKFYEILHLLLLYGASPNIPIFIKKDEKITLLMFGIIQNDIELIKLILNFKPDLEQKDNFERNAIIYAILYNNNDSTEILNLLIKNNVNINYSLYLKNSYHSVLTLACNINLVKIVKCLLDNNVDINIVTQPEGDTCLHVAVKYGSPALVGLLLSYPRINPDITNNQGKKAVELIKQDENEQQMKSLFNNYYNKHNMKDNNLNSFEGGNLNINNINIGNYLVNQNNNLLSQINQIYQFQQKNSNINEGKKFNISNTPPNTRFNFIPQGINLEIKNNGNLSLNNNNLNNYINNNINNNSSDGSMEYGKNNKNTVEIIQIKNNIYNDNNKFKFNQINNTIQLNENKNFKRNSVSNSDIERMKILNYGLGNYNNNNINQNIKQINKNKINILKENFSNKLFYSEKKNFDMEIPVDFFLKKSQKIVNNKSISNFLTKNNIPVLNINLTNNKLLQLELDLLKIKETLREKKKELSEIQINSTINKLDEKINEKEKIKKEKLNESEYFYSNIIKSNAIKIEKLNNTQKLLLDEIRKNKYRELKFDFQISEQNYIYKTLQKDLLDYQKYITYIINNKKKKIEEIIKEIRIIIEQINPNYELKIFGSYAYDLNLPWSDVNLILVNKNKNINYSEVENITDKETTIGEKSENNENLSHKDTNSQYKEKNNINMRNIEEYDLLMKIYQKFENCNWIINLKKNKIENINIIGFNTNKNYEEIEINISIETENHNGMKVVELVNIFLKEYIVLKPLFLALGTILKNANLNIPSEGGLPTYGLILMIVAFIQNKKDDINLEENEYIIGKIFFEFLIHYGMRFDFNKYVIITYEINDTNNFSEKGNNINIGQNTQGFMIIDPLNKKNNVAKATYQFMNIKMAFIISYMITNEDCECGCHYGKASHINKLCSIERSYLKRMFNSVKRF